MMRLPDCIYIGAPKCGTTWLFYALQQHPEVFVAPQKGVNYFDRNAEKPVSWYARHFTMAEAGQVTVDLSHDYYSTPGAARQMAQQVPEAKILCCLREPVDFVISNVNWLYAHTTSYGRSLDDIFRNPEIQRNISYLEMLRPFIAEYPPDRFKLMFFEDLKENPEQYLADVFQFIGVDPEFRPSTLTQRVNASPAPRNKFTMNATFAMARGIRTIGGGALVEAAKKNAAIQRLFYKSAPAPETPSERAARDLIRAEVAARVAKDFDALEVIAKRKLPDAWYRAIS